MYTYYTATLYPVILSDKLTKAQHQVKLCSICLQRADKLHLVSMDF